MAAKTTVKVAVTNNAAKDDYYSDLGWLQEDASLHGQLNVLANDPGSARIIGVSQNLPTSTANMVNSGATFTPTGFSGALVVTIVNGQLDVDASALNADLQSLGEGMSTSISFYYTAQMANGAYSTAKVTIEIEGTNDDPVISASSVLVGIVTDTADDDSFSAVTGSVAATDVDQNDAGLLSFGLADGETGASDYGAFSIDSAGNWTFTPDDAAVEGLKSTVVETFDIKVSDGHGGFATSTVSVTLNGVNDTASIGGDNAGSAAEDGTGTDSGSLSVSDRDVGDGVFQAAGAADLDGALGDFTFNAATGEWAFALDNAAAQGLGEGELAYETLTVTSLDGTDSEVITVTITGKNDAADIAGTDSGDVTEDGTLVASGTLTIDDADGSDEESFQAATVAGAYGTLVLLADGSWTYTLDNGDPGLDDLDSGEQDAETFTVKSVDGTEHVITVDVHGADEVAPFVYVPPVPTNSGTGDPTNEDHKATGASVVVGGGAANPSYAGTPGDDTISAGGTTGNNQMYGGAGNDTLHGNMGNDIIRGGSGNDVVTGGTGNETIWGGDGIDTINGNDGTDAIYGGYGADLLTGGAQADTFVYLSNLDTGDSISDFAAGDKIDLTAFAPSSFIGLLASAGAVGANEVGYMSSAGVTTIYVDTDGVYGADLEIHLANGYIPGAGDFLF
jgi:VCBS repeat-containing protein